MYITSTTNHHLHQPKKELYNGNVLPISSTKGKTDAIEQAFRTKWWPVEIKKSHAWVDESIITQIHTQEYIDYLKSRETILEEWEDSFLNDVPYIRLEKEPLNETAKKWYYCSDTYTPFTKYIRPVANQTYDAVHAAWMHVLQSWWYAYALTRPPGHHAMPGNASGYCYLANGSIIANHIASLWKKVWILDIDYHHWNGAQEIFYDRNDVITTSIHRDPADKFPYYSWFADETGLWDWNWCNLNIPLWAWIGIDAYMNHLETSLQFLEEKWVEFLVVALWFDTLETDPICDFKIPIEWYRQIWDRIKKMNIPTVFIQEGWYDMKNVGKCAVEFFGGYIG